MPLYEYECKECGRRIEKIQKFSDPDLTECPHCHGRLERTLTAAAVQFKGSGWYKDLYSSPKPASASTSDGAKSGDGAKSSDSAAPAASSTSTSDSSSGSSPSSAPSTPASTAAKS